MNTNVDLSQLALPRQNATAGARHVDPRRHLLSRYVVPGSLLVGVATLIMWATRDFVFPPRPVTVLPVLASRAMNQLEGTPLFQAAGWIEPRPTPVRVAALAPGVVEELLVVEDQAVEKGEPIAELVRRDAELSCQGAQADLELREAELTASQATLSAAQTRFDQPVHLEAALGQAEAELASVQTQLASLPYEIRRAEANLAFAKRSYEGKASASGTVSGRLLDQAKSQHESAQALVEQLQSRVASLTQEEKALERRRNAVRSQLELRAEERRDKDEAVALVRAAAARVEQAQVALLEARLLLDRMTVRAPIDGRVLHLIAQPGSRLMFGRGDDGSHDATTVVTLYRPEMLQVRVDVRYEDLHSVHVGQSVSIASPAVTTTIVGQVLIVSSEADVQKNTLGVKVAIDAPASVLKPEMLVDVTFLAPKTKEQETELSDQLLLYIPQQLVEQDESGTAVWVVDSTTSAARRVPVELGRARPDGLVEVTNGLNLTSRLVAEGHSDLRDGERIRVTGEVSE